MDNNTTLLLDLDGLAVASVERLEDGTRRVHLVTTEEGARACPRCGTLSRQVKGSALTRPRDLPFGDRGLEPVWHKRSWYWPSRCAQGRRSPSRSVRPPPEPG